MCALLAFFCHIEFGSENFEEFLGVLGEKIRLRGWERFRGGLDVKGKHFFFKRFSEVINILFYLFAETYPICFDRKKGKIPFLNDVFYI